MPGVVELGWVVRFEIVCSPGCERKLSSTLLVLRVLGHVRNVGMLPDSIQVWLAIRHARYRLSLGQARKHDRHADHRTDKTFSHVGSPFSAHILSRQCVGSK